MKKGKELWDEITPVLSHQLNSLSKKAAAPNGDKESSMENFYNVSPSRLPGLMRTKQSVFDRVFEKKDLVREVQDLRNRL